MVDATDLSPQEVLLLTEIERVRHDIALQVSTEADLDASGGCEILRLEVRKGRPGALGLIGDVVSILVNTSTTGLTTFRSLVFR